MRAMRKVMLGAAGGGGGGGGGPVGGAALLIYDASAITGLAEDDPVPAAKVLDQSGNGNNVVAIHQSGTGTAYKANGLSTGHPAIHFLGGCCYELPNVLTGLTEIEVYFVLRTFSDPAGGDDGSRLCRLGADPTNKFTHFPWTDGTISDGIGTTVRKSVGDPGPVLTTPRLYNVVSAPGEWTARLDTSVLFTTATNTVGFPAPGSDTSLGGSLEGGFIHIGWVGFLSEFRIYATQRTSAQRAAIAAALKTKWNLTGY
jgi:hypothetical protein